MTFDFLSMDVFWRNALGAIPLAIAVALICRWLPCRPSTRHALWLIVLLSLIVPPILPQVDLSGAIAKFQSAPGSAPVKHADAKPSAPDARIQATTPTVASLMAQPECAPHQDLWRQLVQSAKPAEVLAGLVGPVEWKHLPEAANLYVNDDCNAATVPTGQAVQTERTQSQPMNVAASASTLNPQAAFSQDEPQNASIAAGLLAPVAMPHSAAQPAIDSQIDASSMFSSEVASGDVADSSATSKLVESSTTSSATLQWQQWFDGVIAVRDAFVSLTPIPPAFWLLGSAMIVLVLLVRTVRFRRVLRHAVPASHGVNHLVQQASDAIGLRTPPQTLVTNARVSPMIWCGRRRILLLPRDLWAELDNIGRSAVLLHELAHLRRRDHWVRWMELLIGCLYWWHPVVWFVRRKLRDEADFCCDAWVTSLLPGGRGAYAKALLTTRQYISETPYAYAHAVHGPSLGITTNRTKSFARRLTMVMTQRPTPRLSTWGGGMAICLAAAAWLATPLWACPPESKEKERVSLAKMKAAKDKTPRAVVVLAPSVATTSPAEVAEGADATTFERHMAEQEAMRAPTPRVRAWGVGGDGQPNDRLNRLEERLNRLTEQLERMMDTPRAERQPVPGAQGRGGAMAPSRHPEPVMAPSLPRMHPPHAPSAPAAPAAPSAHGDPPAPPAPLAPPAGTPRIGGRTQVFGPGAVGGGGTLRAFAQEGSTVTRIYRLPEGKQQALFNLMARSDVPVFVSEHPEGIAVQATPRQHETFGAFVALIHPEAAAHGRAAAGELSAARAQAMRATELRAAVAGAARGAARARAAVGPEQLESMRRSLTSQQRDMQRQIEELKKRADELSRKARELEKQSEKLQSQAEETQDDTSKDELMSKALAMESEAEAFELEAEMHEDQADALEDLIESLQDQLEDALAAVEDAEFDLEFEQLEAEIEAELESELQGGSN